MEGQPGLRLDFSLVDARSDRRAGAKQGFPVRVSRPQAPNRTPELLPILGSTRFEKGMLRSSGPKSTPSVAAAPVGLE